MTFRNVQFPTDARIGMQWGVKSGVTVMLTGGGQRSTQQNWTRELHRARATHVRPLSTDDSPASVAETIAALLAFLKIVFYERDTFRVKHPVDNSVVRQEFATGTGAEQSYQLIKTYTYSALTADTDVILPVSGTVSIWIDNVLRTETTDFTIDYATGILTTTAALGDITGQSLEWAGEFDLLMALEAPPVTRSVSTEVWEGSIELVEARL